MTEEVVEEVRNPEAVLAENRRVKEDVKNLRAELQALSNANVALEAEVAELKSDPYKTKALAAEVKSTLSELGIKDARALNLINLDELDFDETGNVSGLDERITTLKKEWPEIFDPKVRAGGKADIHVGDVAEPRTDPLKESVRKALGSVPKVAQ